MELSAIGEQVFAVESVVKKRVRKVNIFQNVADTFANHLWRLALEGGWSVARAVIRSVSGGDTRRPTVRPSDSVVFGPFAR